MKLNIPMRLVGPLDRNSLINQLGMPGGNGMRITGAYNTQSLLRQFGSQNAIGYGMNPVNGMNGMNMGMAATAAVAAAAMMQDDHQNYGTPYQNNQNYGPGYQNGPNNGQNYQNNQNYGQAYQNDQNYGQSQDSSAYPNGRPSYADYIDPPSQNQGQVYSTPQPQNQGQVYSTPRPQNQGQVYSTPGPQGQGQVYNTPRPQNQGQVYSTPRPQNQAQNYSAPPPQNQRQASAPAPQPAVQQNNAPKTKAPSLPSGGKVLQRGQKIPLGADLKRMRIGLRWDVRDPGCELDASAFLLAENEKVPSEDWFVFYGQVQSPEGSTRYQGYDLGGCDLMIDLAKVSQNIKKISLAVTIYEAVARNQNFSRVNSVSAVIINTDSGQVVASIDLTNCSSVVTALVVGELYRHNGEWKFNAVGSGVSRDLAGFCSMYGVELE
ncbi:TerD family protein [Ruminococcus sp. HUN007]|uniref:TerD family protein n=1 Tax=Ruminococcus sp. HUN007 TaxID=1514668 RepID=UPI0006785FCD|nr:TerD family protein [Ruminococcus sp. HUN007]